MKSMTRWVKGHGAMVAMVVLMSVIMVGWQNQAGAATVQLFAIADSYVSSAAPTTNYGTDITLRVSGTQSSYLKFDLTAIPDGSIIQSAIFTGYSRDLSGTPTVLLSLLSNDTWSESSVNYNTRPNLTGTVTPSSSLTITNSLWSTLTPPGTPIIYDNWEFSSYWSNFGSDLTDNFLSLMLARSSTGTAYVNFGSQNNFASYAHPYLTINYAAAPVPLPPSALLLGSGLLGLIGLRRWRRS